MSKVQSRNAAAVATPPEAAADEANSPEERGFARSEFGTIPFELSVSIARGSVELRRLIELAPREVLTLETPIGAPARLLVDDHPLAEGEIVEIKGRLQIRVTGIGVSDE